MIACRLEIIPHKTIILVCFLMLKMYNNRFIITLQFLLIDLINIFTIYICPIINAMPLIPHRVDLEQETIWNSGTTLSHFVYILQRLDHGVIGVCVIWPALAIAASSKHVGYKFSSRRSDIAKKNGQRRKLSDTYASVYLLDSRNSKMHVNY